MTKATDEQPAPKATDKRPMWPEVIAYVQRNYEDDPDGIQAVSKLVADMHERDRVGRERYKVPLTAGNGRDSAIDAYQELLDFVVYCRTWLEDHGIEPMTPEVPMKALDDPNNAKPEKLVLSHIETMFFSLFTGATETLLQLRGALDVMEQERAK